MISSLRAAARAATPAADQHAEYEQVYVQLPDAAAVYLAGDFNNWSTVATPMQRLRDGSWTVRLNLQAPLQHYCFFVWCRHARFGRVMRPHDSNSEPVRPHARERGGAGSPAGS